MNLSSMDQVKKIAVLVIMMSFAIILSGCVSALNNAAAKGNIEEVRAQLKAGANVNEKNEALSYAAYAGQIDIVRILLDAGADVNEKDPSSRRPALHTAASHGYIEVAKLLLDKGANVNATDYFHRTPLVYAALGFHTDMIKLLISKGADLDAAIAWTESQKGWEGEAKLLAKFAVLKQKASEGYKEVDSAAETAFANEAKRYREIPVKPALPEDVQRYRVVAEDAFKNKDFEKALEYYRKGLALEPLWPQGQFNAAMLAGELHWYNWAALYMKRYLLLVPDAANAKTAREKMYLWEVKAKE